MKNYLTIILIFIFASCSNKKVEITQEYIINENWNKKNEQASANSITIYKMKVKKDSTINPFSSLTQTEILNKLEEDSTFMHNANIKIKEGENYNDRKIYFNKDNGFYWGSKSRYDDSGNTKTIGNLQAGNWYRFSDLALITHPYYIYVYIDSTSKVHRYDVNLSNY